MCVQLHSQASAFPWAPTATQPLLQLHHRFLQITGGLESRQIGKLVNEFCLILLFILRDYKELSEVMLPHSLGSRKAHGQDFDLVSISLDQGREEGHVVTLILQRGNDGDGK